MKWLKKLLKLGIWLAFAGLLTGLAGAIAAYVYLVPQLPSTDNLRSVKYQVPLRVYTADGKLMGEFGEKRRVPLEYREIPPRMIQAFLAAEDDRFFEHPGVDYQGLLRAGVQLILTGKKRQGGSTITMQVARNFYLSSEKTYLRKLNEILLALQIERDLDKEQILQLYLNKIYLGNRSYGVGAAAEVYYGKTVDQLSLPEIAMIAGLPKAPSAYNPLANPTRALQRRDYVLGRMQELGFIDSTEYQEALKAPITASLHKAQVELQAPYVAEMVRAELFERFDTAAYTDGYTVRTTIDSKRQQAANQALRKALQDYDYRHGYRGPERQFTLDPEINLEAEPESGKAKLLELIAGVSRIGELEPALVVSVQERSAQVLLTSGELQQLQWNAISWARPYETENRLGAEPEVASDILKVGDLIRLLPNVDDKGVISWQLSQVPAVSGALVSLDPDDGALQALVGGYDFFASKFNRAIQAERQPGSGFKAFIYSAALEAGFTPASLINDAPVVFDDPSLEGAWRPENYSGKFFGPTRLRWALTKSRNLVSIRLLRSMGIKFAVDYASRFGFDPDKLPHNLSLALGSASVTPMQMAAAYAILANGGYRVEPYFITEIRDDQDQVIYRANPLVVCEDCPQQEDTTPSPADQVKTADAGLEPGLRLAPRVITPQNHYLMNSMMRDVITRGTARKARALGRKDLAGKTGTTNDQRDAWFNGFNRKLVTIAWVGFDSSEPLGRGEVGGRAALPAWIDYMRIALADTPEQPLPVPPGIVTIRIDPTTGKRASAEQTDAIFEVFRAENAPKETPRIAQPGPPAGNGGAGAAAPEPEIF